VKTHIQNITNYHLDYRGKPDNGTSALFVLPVDGSERKYEINLICGTDKETETKKECESVSTQKCISKDDCKDIGNGKIKKIDVSNEYICKKENTICCKSSE